MIKIDFSNKNIDWKCEYQGSLNPIEGCSRTRQIPFESFKSNKYFITCTPCENMDEKGIPKHSHSICTHCSWHETFNLTCFVQNLELHDEPRKMQVNPDVWENNRQYHILRRMLEHNKEYDEVKDEPDLYEKVHKIVGKKAFHKVWVEHEQGIKDMREYIHGQQDT